MGAGLWVPRAGTELVDVYYDLAATAPPVAVAVQVSADGLASYAVPAVSLSGDLTLLPGTDKHLVWNAGADWDGQFSARLEFKPKTNRLSGHGGHGTDFGGSSKSFE